MALRHSAVALIAALAALTATPPASAQDETWLKASPERMAEWQDLGFGMFMHWDPSSLLGVEISWHRESPFNGPIPDEGYDNLYRSFYPGQFDAAAIAKTAKDAGMKYIVITAKHCGGFLVDITWREGRLVSAKVTSLLGRPAVLRYGSTTFPLGLAKDASFVFMP